LIVFILIIKRKVFNPFINKNLNACDYLLCISKESLNPLFKN